MKAEARAIAVLVDERDGGGLQGSLNHQVLAYDLKGGTDLPPSLQFWPSRALRSASLYYIVHNQSPGGIYALYDLYTSR
jgi:hypothetical protein